MSEASTSSVRIETGSCFCGDIVATMHGEPFWIVTDHDGDCRKAVGSPLSLWIGYRPDEVKFKHGTPRSFSRTSGVERSFCATCGTSIGYTDSALANEIYLTVGFFDHPERFAPQAHAYWSERLPWVEFNDDLPRREGYTRNRDAEIGTPAQRQASVAS